MSQTITRNQARRSLLTSPPLNVTVVASKSVSAITRSGTTATVTCTAHGLSVNDWFILSGADRPPYNGLFQVASVVDANNVTCAIEYDPGASAGGTMALQKAFVSLIWGDGSTGVGAEPTAVDGDLVVRVCTTTAPTTACRVSVFRSDTGALGTWRLLTAIDSTVTANDESTHIINVPRGKFVILAFGRVAGTAVFVDVVANEDTSYTSSP